MLLRVDIESKSIGNKELFKNLSMVVENKEKVALIGRNGVGKTTLFNMLSNLDHDYDGSIQKQRGSLVVSTSQEHHNIKNQTVVEYILQNLPEYKKLKHILDSYPKTMDSDIKKISTYSAALDKFSALNYYNVEKDIIDSLDKYQITPTMAIGPMSNLSGGQKRFVELVRIEHADADIILLDEPTNHMDYVAKFSFVEWLKSIKKTVIVITHDRDVLQYVDKIIELKDLHAFTFKGNYHSYLNQNAVNTITHMNDYKVGLRTLSNLKKQIEWARARKPSWHGTADQKNPFVVMETRLQKEYDQIESKLTKPSFWIDRESVENLDKKVSENYSKFKTKNIRMHKSEDIKQVSELLSIEKLQLGYNKKALFDPINFQIQYGQRLQLIGRNGAGKTTLVKAIIMASRHKVPSTLISGSINNSNKLQLSIYDQEFDEKLIDNTLYENIEHIYSELGIKLSDQLVMRTMGDYLFDPKQDGRLKVSQLSGGQKARLQIIKMLAGEPNLLILDEPTNHLDLPSIEELENTLIGYKGAVIYVSHDSYFAKNLGGEKINLDHQ